MNIKAMSMFLSEDNIKRHLEQLRTYRLRLSILEKSLPELKGKDINEINRLPLERKAKEEALVLHWAIKSHECFFDSFSEMPGRSEMIDKHYSSRDSFIYNLYTEGMKSGCGFLYVYVNRSVPKTLFLNEFDMSFLRIKPILTLDLFEHTYFLDYGFAKDRFLRSALSYLNTGKLST